MKISDIIEKINGKILSCENKVYNNAEGVYVCDLLSLAMARLNANNVWITIQTNINIIAVASLADASCIIIPEGFTVDENVLNTANIKDVLIISTDLTAYEICLKIGGIIPNLQK